MGDNALRKLAAKPGLVQVLCVCVREKQGWLGSGRAHRDLFPPVKDVTGSHVVALSLALSSSSISLCSLFLSPSCSTSLCLCPRLPPLTRQIQMKGWIIEFAHAMSDSPFSSELCERHWQCLQRLCGQLPIKTELS